MMSVFVMIAEMTMVPLNVYQATLENVVKNRLIQPLQVLGLATT